MACAISCLVSAVFVIAMIYFYNSTERSPVVQHYKASLSTDLQERYARITEERKWISYQGYGLGLLLSLVVIFLFSKRKSSSSTSSSWNTSMICTVIAISFATNYFYYSLHPKSDWMLNHMHKPEEVRAWLQMYREMQYQYHMGFVFGIVAVGVLAFAFRC